MLRVPFASTRSVCCLAPNSALRLSPVPPALLCTVKLSPAAGVPLICTCQPFWEMLPPAVYAKLPAPLMEYVVGDVNCMVVAASKLGLEAVSTVPLLIVAVPVLLLAGVALTAPAAAIWLGL